MDKEILKKELIRAIRCSNGTEQSDCAKEKCKYFYRDPQEVIDKFRELSDDFFEACDYEQIMLDAADELEKLCEDREKYRWHDLRENPYDLPEDGRLVDVRDECGNSYYTHLDFFSTNIWFSKVWHYSIHGIEPIAWREIEPFEPEERCPNDYHGGDC